ncbi:MAG: hypothetical protein ACKESB_02950 [Candidatus Hodgkinia cicadicola]
MSFGLAKASVQRKWRKWGTTLTDCSALKLADRTSMRFSSCGRYDWIWLIKV